MTNALDADLEAVSAFVDGEPVDAAALARALADAAGRDYLIDLLRLRQAVQGAELQAVTPAPKRRPRLRAVAAWSVPVVLVAVFASGYFARPHREPAVQATEARVSAADASRSATEPSAPPPTVVIDLKPGVSWFERAEVR